jgi:hypothetical protein
MQVVHHGASAIADASHADRAVLAELEREHSVRGCWQRLFPAADARKYLAHMASTRYLNLLVTEWTTIARPESQLCMFLSCATADEAADIGGTSDMRQA